MLIGFADNPIFMSVVGLGQFQKGTKKVQSAASKEVMYLMGSHGMPYRPTGHAV